MVAKLNKIAVFTVNYIIIAAFNSQTPDRVVFTISLSIWKLATNRKVLCNRLEEKMHFKSNRTIITISISKKKTCIFLKSTRNQWIFQWCCSFDIIMNHLTVGYTHCWGMDTIFDNNNHYFHYQLIMFVKIIKTNQY